MGIYDLPAIINYITNFKNVSDLFYIGHSQGTLASYIMISMKQNIAKKIRLMMHLSPVVYLTNTKGILIYARPFFYFLNVIEKKFLKFIHSNFLNEYINMGI